MRKPDAPNKPTKASPTFGAMTAEMYSAKINTPAKDPNYYRWFHRPLIERAIGSKAGDKITLIDVACGPALELDFFKDNPRVHSIGVDMEQRMLSEAQQRLPGAKFYCWDVRNEPPLPPGIRRASADAGILLNAMIYVPDRMLCALGYGLKGGGLATVNFRVHGNPFNEAFYHYYTERQGVIREERHYYPTREGGKEGFVMAALDYSQCIDLATGAPDPVRNLATQLYFRSGDDIIRLIEISGLSVATHTLFHFASAANPDNEIEVYTIMKP